MRLAASFFRPHFSFEFKKSRKYGMLAGFLRLSGEMQRLPYGGNRRAREFRPLWVALKPRSAARPRTKKGDQ